MLGMLRLARGLDVEAIAKLCRRPGRFAPPPLSADERARLTSGEPRRCATLGGRRLSRMARHAPRPCVRRRAGGGGGRAGGRARRSTCASTHLKADRERASAELAELAPQPDAVVAGRTAHQARPGCEERRPSMPSRPSSKAMSRCRTRARSLPHCFTPLQNRASRWSISVPAPAAKAWRLPPTWTIAGQIFATDTDKRRLAPVHARLEGQACAMSRCGRRAATPTSWPISPGAPTWS